MKKDEKEARVLEVLEGKRAVVDVKGALRGREMVVSCGGFAEVPASGGKRTRRERLRLVPPNAAGHRGHHGA